ncbi:uncharacterized protein LOC135375268 isoform X2 [Ornithodoros turicata]
MRNILLGGVVTITVISFATGSQDELPGIGARCQTTEECHTIVPNSKCVYDGCFCLRSHYFDGRERSCKPVSLLGDACSHDNHCGSSLMCQQGTCTCMPGYRQGFNACEPVGSLSDFESYGELPTEKPNIFVVVLKGLGFLALKVSLIYLFAKIMCVSCKHLARDSALQEVCSDDMYKNTASTSGVQSIPTMSTGTLASTVMSAVPLQTSFYSHQTPSMVYVQGPATEPTSLQCKTEQNMPIR